MVTLHQLLEARLDLGPLGVGFEPQHMQRLALGVALGVLAALAALGSRAELAEHIERILRLAKSVEEARAARLARALSAEHPHLPGRPVAGDRVLLIARDRVVAHAGEVVIRMIVLAHVIEAEAPVLALLGAPLRGAMGRSMDAARPVAARQFRARPAILVRLDANAIEQR